MVKAVSIWLIIKLIKKYPNDTDLGRELRKLMKDEYGIK